EPQPVGVVGAVAGVGGEEPLRRGVGADHECDVAEAGEDAGPGDVDGHGARRAGAVAGGHLGPAPAEGLGDRRPGDVAGVAVADGLAAGDELHVAPGDAGVGERLAGGLDAVLHEVAAPLAPRGHARAGDDDVAAHAVTFHFQIRNSWSSSSKRASTASSARAPTWRSSTVVPAVVWPNTT